MTNNKEWEQVICIFFIYLFLLLFFWQFYKSSSFPRNSFTADGFMSTALYYSSSLLLSRYTVNAVYFLSSFLKTLLCFFPPTFFLVLFNHSFLCSFNTANTLCFVCSFLPTFLHSLLWSFNSFNTFCFVCSFVPSFLPSCLSKPFSLFLHFFIPEYLYCLLSWILCFSLLSFLPTLFASFLFIFFVYLFCLLSSVLLHLFINSFLNHVY